jgi:hypothetical protein
MELLDKKWITGRECIGIVKCKNDIGEIKYFMRPVSGMNEEDDTQAIIDYGTKVDPKDLIRFLSSE